MLLLFVLLDKILELSYLQYTLLLHWSLLQAFILLSTAQIRPLNFNLFDFFEFLSESIFSSNFKFSSRLLSFIASIFRLKLNLNILLCFALLDININLTYILFLFDYFLNIRHLFIFLYVNGLFLLHSHFTWILNLNLHLHIFSYLFLPSYLLLFISYLPFVTYYLPFLLFNHILALVLIYIRFIALLRPLFHKRLFIFQLNLNILLIFLLLKLIVLQKVYFIFVLYFITLLLLLKRNLFLMINFFSFNLTYFIFSILKWLFYSF